MTYAFTRELDPQTGDWRYTTRFEASGTPALEQVKRVLRTQRGTCLLDPERGVDWARLDPMGTGALALADSLLRTALSLLEKRGVIEDMKIVSLEVDNVAGRILYEVEFTDVRARRRGLSYSGASR